MLSGLETLVLTAGEEQRLERKQRRHLRALMAGGACDWSGSHPVALSNCEVRRRLGFATIKSELQSRRLQWLQSVAFYPEHNSVLLATLTGKYSWEDYDQLDDQARPTCQANPWLRQWYQDLELVGARCECFAADLVEHGWFAIFRSAAFHSFEPKVLHMF